MFGNHSKKRLQTQQPSPNRFKPRIAAISELRDILADSLPEFIQAIFREREVVFAMIGVVFSDRGATVAGRIIVHFAAIFIDDMKDDLFLPAIASARKALQFLEYFG